MKMLLVTFVVMLFLVTIMAIGVLMGRKPIKGSCGGVGNALGDPDYICDLCGNDPKKCEEETEKAAKAAGSNGNFYDAS
ncbi:(Na+)-NQR maturation NqrM [Litorivivens sp.]|uniref:(Na+)-NQR maturation NqrM n=1 Tax=Litorivivens sp. TaxID=2020868 RepID=UPI0035638970